MCSVLGWSGRGTEGGGGRLAPDTAVPLEMKMLFGRDVAPFPGSTYRPSQAADSEPAVLVT